MASEPSGVGVWSPKIRDEALVRKFLSQYGNGYVAISIQNGVGEQAQPVDPDTGTLGLTIWFNDVVAGMPVANPYGVQMLSVAEDALIRTDVGKFHYNIDPSLTSNRGLITCVWTYTVAGSAFSFTDHLQILDPMPLYDSFSDSEKSVVEQVTWMFGDMFDSTEGGPHLIEEFQSHWNYERIAQMTRLAVQRMNLIGNYNNPPTTWSVGRGTATYTVPGNSVTVTQKMPDGSETTTTYNTSPSTNTSGVPSNMFPLVVLGARIECMRHFRDSYTEIPNRPGMDVTYTDRRDYWSRWQSNLQAEEQEWTMMVRKAKASLLNLSRGSLLVAGGIYGGSALGIFQAGTYASQVRSWRFYPAAPAISWGATAH